MSKPATKWPENSNGFTLIELSIVLVIIGLLAGGVLVGQDLIAAAKVRAQVTQIEKYNTAINTFRSKYSGMPGDLKAVDAAALGFVARSGAGGHGDGDRLLEYCEDLSADPAEFPIGCETILFWSDLGRANLIADSFPATTDAAPNTTTLSDALLYTPRAKVVDDATVFALSYWVTGKIWFVVTQFMYDGTWQYNPRIPPKQAYSIDIKIDDAKPLTGSVQAGHAITIPAEHFFLPPPQSATACVNVAGDYNFADTITINCQLNFRAQY